MNPDTRTGLNIEGNIQQISDCLKTYDDWGVTNIINICTDQTWQIPWGVNRWIACGILCLLGIFIIMGLIFLLQTSFDD